MNTSVIALVTACTALIAGLAGPAVSLLVARQQTRVSVISSNRQKWAEALRDLVAEYVALVLTVSITRQALGENFSATLSSDAALLETAERVALAKSKILLMINPDESGHSELCQVIEVAYLALISEAPPPLTRMRGDAEAITRAGRAVLRAAWQRVKRGD